MHNVTKSPSLLTESSLISSLETLKIGRPSTYANITAVLLKRKYVTLVNNKALRPTKLGLILNWFLQDNFGEYVSTKFTAEMEQILENIKVVKTEL